MCEYKDSKNNSKNVFLIDCSESRVSTEKEVNSCAENLKNFKKYDKSSLNKSSATTGGILKNQILHSTITITTSATIPIIDTSIFLNTSTPTTANFTSTTSTTTNCNTPSITFTTTITTITTTTTTTTTTTSTTTTNTTSTISNTAINSSTSSCAPRNTKTSTTFFSESTITSPVVATLMCNSTDSTTNTYSHITTKSITSVTTVNENFVKNNSSTLTLSHDTKINDLSNQLPTIAEICNRCKHCGIVFHDFNILQTHLEKQHKKNSAVICSIEKEELQSQFSKVVSLNLIKVNYQFFHLFNKNKDNFFLK